LKVLIATGEQQTSCLIEPLSRHGHDIVGVLLPAAFPPLSRRPRSFLFRLKYGTMAGLIGNRQIAHRVEDNLTEGSLLTWIRSLAPDLLVVLSWPTRMPASFLDLFKHGAVNIHPSLLPALRGRDPIFSAILNNEPGFGITFHKLTSKLDSGPIYLQRPLKRRTMDHYDKLYFRFMRRVGELLPLAIDHMLKNPNGVPQKGKVSKAITFQESHTIYSADDEASSVIRKTLACRYHHRMNALCGKTLITFQKCTDISHKMAFKEECPRILAVRPGSLLIHHGHQVLKLQQVRILGVHPMLSPFIMLKYLKKGQRLAHQDPTLAALRVARSLTDEKNSPARHYKT